MASVVIPTSLILALTVVCVNAELSVLEVLVFLTAKTSSVALIERLTSVDLLLLASALTTVLQSNGI
jgi:hypothetical protein